MQKFQHQTLVFADFTLDLTRGCLMRGEQEIKLRPKSFEVLRHLVEHGGRLVSKDELIEAAWPGTAVTDDSLVQCLIEVRRALGDKEQRIIKTVPRRGYLFATEVRENDAAAGEAFFQEQVECLRVVIEEEGEDGTSGGKKLLPSPAPAGSFLPGRSQYPSRALALVITLGVIVLSAVAFFVYRRVDNQSHYQIAQVRSIAVLPFRSVSGQERDEALELGVADAIITRLSNVKQINVRVPGAVFKYAGQSADPVQAGRELKVDAVLDGSIQRQGDRVRVSVQLVSVADGRALWADKFDAKGTDFFAAQDALSEQITRLLTLKLTGTEQISPIKRYTLNAEAYQFCLKGRYWWVKGTPEGFQKAIDYYNQAIALDKDNALAYVWLADSYTLQASTGLVPPNESLIKAKAAAEKAIQLDDSLHLHGSLGHLKWLTWDWAGAEKEFQYVVESDPPYPPLWYATFLSSLGRHQEALAIIKKGQEQDPISISVNSCAIRIHLFARQYDEAIAAGLKTLELEPNYSDSIYWLAHAYEQKGMFEEVVSTRLRAMSLKGESPEEIEKLRAAYGASGWRGYWLKEIELNLERVKHKYIPRVEFAKMYVRIGDRERAFEFLEQAYSERSGQLTLLKVDPIFDSLRSDPRFTDLMRRVGLTP